MVNLPRLIPFKLVAGTGFAIFAGMSLSLFFRDSGGTIPVMAGIFGFAVVMWIFEIFPLWVTGILVIVAQLLFVPLPDGPIDYLKQIKSPTMILILGGLCLGGALQHGGASSQLIGKWMRAIGDRPKTLVIGLMFVTAFLAMWMTNTAAAAVTLPLILPLFTRLEAHPNLRKSLLLAIGFGANLGAIATPVGTAPNLIAITLLRERGFEITFAQWMGMTLPFAILLLGIGSLLLIRLYPPENSPLPIFQVTSQKWTPRGIASLVILASTGALWLLSPYHPIPESMVALGAIALILATRLLSPRQFLALDWGLLVLIWSGLVLGLGIEKSGLAQVLIQLPIFQITPYSLAIGLIVMALILSATMSNTATAIMIMPVALNSLPATQSWAVIFIALSCSVGMFLPISTPANMLIFSKSWLRTKDILAAGGFISIAGLILLILGYLIISH